MLEEKITLVLLPGLNGTEGLFKPLIAIKPNNINVLTIAYPTQQYYSNQQLSKYVLEKINHLRGDFVLVGESFSGPVALLVTQAKPDNLKGVILVATFIKPPTLSIVKFLPWTFGFQLFKFLGKFFRKLDPVVYAACRELQIVDTHVLVRRIDSIFSVNAEASLNECVVPIMYLRGTKDFLVPEKNLQQIISIKNDVTVVKCNTDHFLLQRAPVEAWVAIKKFCSQFQ